MAATGSTTTAATRQEGEAKRLIEGVRGLGERIRDNAEQIEAVRRVPAEIVDELAALGVFRMVAPGPGQADPVTFVGVCEELAYADGSTGWIAGIAGATSVVMGYLGPDVADRMLADPKFLIAGVAAPVGLATPCDGGYRVRGRWSFASGCEHATWLVGGCRVPGDRPVRRMMIMPAAAMSIHDNWDVAGLRGTGSHDIEADDVFVPQEHSFSLADPHEGFPVMSQLALGLGAVPLGIARAAIGEFIALAQVKNDPMTGQSLAGKGWARAAVAEAESLRASALAYLLSEAAKPDPRGVDDVARLRLAIATAARSAARAVDLMYDAAGGASLYTSSPLQRHFRDVHAATQHAMVGPDLRETVGAVLLGEDVNTARL
ncbi:acyl-CoA dehydrogenase family protein [Mangrovihabitans endophyticus]|uniref:Hydroxylase n=1 Tax=Mangrovihabitans endophyticus TaxID=1751298 RepID=A0A8J3C194_9ACTN|nr:acyl-CoA dehydrogenase family protein [Mangrovihabitans endophyticus]GGK95909.1 hydroxylase [Mangrovihabitans endophyticus]